MEVQAIEFRVCAVPIAQPRPRAFAMRGKDGAVHARVHGFDRRHPVTDFKAHVRLAAGQAYRGQPLAGPVRVSLLFLLPRPARLVWKRKPMPRCWHTVTPDGENLAKSVLDALKGLTWGDDAQVARLLVEKWYASGHEEPGVVVCIGPLKEAASPKGEEQPCNR